MQTDLIRLMSNQALRAFAQFDKAMADISPRNRWDAIDARKELDRRDRIAALGNEA